jgi:DNA-binding response OmpR family regulator
MYLEAAGFDVALAARGDEGLRMAEEGAPHLVILDLMLPGLDGYEVTKRLRQKGQTPIIMLTARDDAVDKVVGLELGADDYITKPFNPRELVARVRAVLRRAESGPAAAGQPQTSTIEVDQLRIEVGGREVFVAGEAVALTPKEFDLLVTLIENRGLVLTREQLLERVWGFTFLGDSRTIDVHVRQLRRKLGDACPIQTVWGTGYKVPAKR